MSKKALISEGVARRWAKYAGIQNESKVLLETIYEEDLEEGMLDELDAAAAEKMVGTAAEDALDKNSEEEKALEEVDVLAELEEMLAEQDDELEDDELEDEDEMDDEDMEAEIGRHRLTPVTSRSRMPSSA